MRSRHGGRCALTHAHLVGGNKQRECQRCSRIFRSEDTALAAPSSRLLCRISLSRSRLPSSLAQPSTVGGGGRTSVKGILKSKYAFTLDDQMLGPVERRREDGTRGSESLSSPVRVLVAEDDALAGRAHRVSFTLAGVRSFGIAALSLPPRSLRDLLC